MLEQQEIEINFKVKFNDVVVLRPRMIKNVEHPEHVLLMKIKTIDST